MKIVFPLPQALGVRAALTSAVLAALLLAPGPLAAQWLNYQTPGVPKNADGSPNLNAPAPRTADGKPDLSGVWMILLKVG